MTKGTKHNKKGVSAPKTRVEPKRGNASDTIVIHKCASSTDANVNLKGTSTSNANAKRKRENTQQGAKVKKTRMKNDNLTDPLSQEPVLGRSSNKQTQETISIDKGMMTTSSLSSDSVETDYGKKQVYVLGSQVKITSFPLSGVKGKVGIVCELIGTDRLQVSVLDDQKYKVNHNQCRRTK